MKWGIMSAANIAKKMVIPAIQRAENAEIEAIASLSGNAEETAASFDIPKTYDTYEGLLADEEVEAVYIPLPNHLHKEWTIKAARAGKHVLCEKPAALSRADVEDMIEACNENGVYFLEAFMYQFHPQHQRVKELIQEGHIGDVRLIKPTFSFNLDPSSYNIRLDADKGGGALWDLGCYGVHSALNLVNEQVKDWNVSSSIHPTYHVDTTTLAALTLENDVKVSIECSFDVLFRDEYQVVGTEGMIHVHHAYRPDAKEHLGKITLTKVNGEKLVYHETGDQYRLQVETFMNAINNQESLQPYHEATKTYLDVVEKLQEEMSKQTNH
ncbi:Gfo/Idh/MocA family protein [Halobacillus halophilus]|uniref:Gfo/Idh/MocA family protein n=1 Tax=Halobacillus halophilus TaxID=1570 RepID=UPI001CD69364|nr:Gfo/Idh/MocA family oxidoreductase [Halobacillus halophilus]MCA1011783.1 Gfo/Idh/MocA family oxidoreductase [Halobacillus halophilus]